MTQQRDNSTFVQKVALRKQAMKRLAAQPFVLETHGGYGAVFNACYAHLERGIVFDKMPDRTTVLAKQRPTWAVYEADCEQALADGVGGHAAVELLDVDPYGSPWETLAAFFGSERAYAGRMLVVVNDGLRQKLQLRGAWTVGVLQPMVERFGNDLYPIYLDVCKLLMGEITARAGYALAHFAGYYCGFSGAMTHYLAVLER